MVAAIVTDALVNGEYGLFGTFQNLEKVRAVKQQNAGNIIRFVELIGFAHHLFQDFYRNVITKMAAIDESRQHGGFLFLAFVAHTLPEEMIALSSTT